MEITPYQIAHNFIGVREIPGIVSNPLIVAMGHIDNKWITDDDVAWCSSFVNFVCFCLGIQRTKSARARSWLKVGAPVLIKDATVGWDIVIIKRGQGQQPGPEVMNAPGHVGFYAGHTQDKITLLAGNQGNQVSLASFPIDSILGIRRLSDKLVDCEYGASA